MTKHSAATHTALAAALSFSLLAVLVQLGLTRPFDEAGLSVMLAVRTPALTNLMLVFTTAGGTGPARPDLTAESGRAPPGREFGRPRGGRTTGTGALQ